MNICFLCDEQDKEAKMYLNDFLSFIDDMNIKKPRIKIFREIDTNRVMELYVVYSNKLEFVKEIINKIRKKVNILIVTSNLSNDNIVGCIKISPDIIYMKNPFTIILSKILEIKERSVKREKKQ